MELRLLTEHLSPEELETEYSVRKLSPLEVGAELKLRQLLQEERQNPQLKPKLSHVTERPEQELNVITAKFDELELLLEAIDDNSSLEYKQSVLIKLIHWKDRAVRLGNSFANLASVSLVIKTFERTIRSLGRDLKKIDFKNLPSAQDNSNQASTSKDAGLAKHNRSHELGTDREWENSDFDATFESRFSKKIEEMTSKFLKQASLTKPPTRHSKSRKSENHSRNNMSDNGSYSDSSEGNQSVSHRRNKQEPSKRYSKRRSDPTKWKLSFTGKENSRGCDNIQDFIMRMEEHAYQDDVPKRELVTLMRNFVSGVAEKWYYVFIRKNKNTSWRQLKSALLERFSSLESERAQRRYIRGRMQESRESFNDFILEIEMSNCRLSRPLPEDDILEIVLDNMNPALKNATQNQDFEDIEELRKICSNYEKLWSTSGYDPRKLIESRHKRTRAVEEIARSNSQDQHIISKENLRCSESEDSVPDNRKDDSGQHVNSFERRNSVIICWNCKDIGHTFAKCPLERTHNFCYGCGLAGRNYDDCYRCLKKRAGNGSPNVNRGVLRSENNKVPKSSQQVQKEHLASTSKD